jgi:pyrroline-5-carboxylate reductase
MKMAKYQFGFIGCGNMGGALVRAISAQVPAEHILIADRIANNTEQLQAQCGVCVAADAAQVAQEAQYIFLGVKPQGMRALLTELSDLLKSRQDRFVLISMAAGITLSSLQEMLNFPNTAIIRILPNTPAAVGKGMTLYCCNSCVTAEEEHTVVQALMAAGNVDCLDEGLIDAGCAISGCGPAFVYLFMEALADGGVAAGLPRQKALMYAVQTVIGAAETLMQSGKHPGELKDAVCSPGGSTIQGVMALEDGAFRSDVIQAVLAAYEKTRELGNK